MSLVLNKLKVQRRLWLIDERKDDGFNALHLACLNNHFDLVKLLITTTSAPQLSDSTNIININLKNLNQQTALHLAVERQHLQVIKLLIENKCNINAEDKDGETPLHVILRHHTLLYLREVQEIQNVSSLHLHLIGGEINTSQKNKFSILIKFCIYFKKSDLNSSTTTKTSTSTSQTINKKSSANIALLLVQNGADINIKNKKQQTALDLCTDLSLNKQLQKLVKELTITRSFVSSSTSPLNSQESNNLFDKNNEDSLEECMICSDNKRDTLFKPCNHVLSCYQCSSRCKKCLICKEAIQERVKIDNCLVCSDNKSNVLFEPCGHLCSCDSCSVFMKKCVHCRMPIEKCISLSECCSTVPIQQQQQHALSTPVEAVIKDNASSADVEKLKRQLEDIKEQTMCPVCLDRLKNMIFLCGHGTCQKCGDRINECPICRKDIQKRIVLY